MWTGMKAPFSAALPLAAVLCACDPGYDAAARAESHLGEGVEALVAGEFDRAWPLCDEARRLRPDSDGALRCVVLAAVGWGRWDLAATDLEVLLERSGLDAEAWIPITLWLARVRNNDRAGAIRVLDGLRGERSDHVRQGILALAMVEGVDHSEWGFTEARLRAWPGVLPQIQAAGHSALKEALAGKVRPGSPDAPPIPDGIRSLLAAAAGEPLEPISGSEAERDTSLILLRRFYGAEGDACTFGGDLPETSRIQAAAALLEGICLERRGELDPALVRYDRAVALVPWHLTTRLNRALLLARMDRVAAARVELAHLSGAAQGHPILRVLEGLLAGAEGDSDTLTAVRAELAQTAPAYLTWMNEVLAE